jgi:hypothetical protein
MEALNIIVNQLKTSYTLQQIITHITSSYNNTTDDDIYNALTDDENDTPTIHTEIINENGNGEEPENIHQREDAGNQIPFTQNTDLEVDFDFDIDIDIEPKDSNLAPVVTITHSDSVDENKESNLVPLVTITHSESVDENKESNLAPLVTITHTDSVDVSNLAPVVTITHSESVDENKESNLAPVVTITHSESVDASNLAPVVTITHTDSVDKPLTATKANIKFSLKKTHNITENTNTTAPIVIPNKFKFTPKIHIPHIPITPITPIGILTHP